MLHIFNISRNFFIYSIGLLLLVVTMSSFANESTNNELGYSVKNSKLKSPLNKLYSHGHHLSYFTNMGVKCVDCHNFSIKTQKTGPLAPLVDMRTLSPSRKVCHECHLGQISIPRRNQCSLCHDDVDALKPKDHNLAWKSRHGVKAQFDSDSCKQCHQQNECSECHIQRDNMNPRVHRGNFKYMHSISARAKPASCVNCHQSQSFCNDCHSGRRK